MVMIHKPAQAHLKTRHERGRTTRMQATACMAIGRVSNVLRSPSPDPSHSAKVKLVTKPAMIMTTAFMLWVAAIYLFTIVAPWTAAIETESIPGQARADALKSKWVAAIKEHGVWRQWERGTVSQRPAFFAAHLAALLVCGQVAFRLGVRASKTYKAEQVSVGNGGQRR